MRPLWPIERAVIEATANDYPALADDLRRQAETAGVTSFENSGGGFFSNVTVSTDAPALPNNSRLEGAIGAVEGIEHGMGFIVSLEDGRLSVIEGYSHGGASTADVDFAVARFDIRPWSKSGDLWSESSD